MKPCLVNIFVMAIATMAFAQAMASLIQDGFIRHAPAELSRYVGLRIEVLFDELGALSHPAP